jgi:glutamate carboxypeptidase
LAQNLLYKISGGICFSSHINYILLERSLIMSKILYYLKENQTSILQSLERFVRAESPSGQKGLVDQCGGVLEELFFEHLGIRGETISQSEVGNHLKFTYGEGNEQILIIGHFDTVWDLGRLPYRIEENRAYGPGIFDMKGGIIQCLWALKTLKNLGINLNKKIVFLCNSDEEIGSITSRSIIEAEAKKSKAVFIPEPSVSKTGALKTSRKGVGIFKIKVKGVASHAGNHHEEGISAIEELAHQIQTLHKLTNYNEGTTVNVGTIQGGTRGNVVADGAEAEIDLRVTTVLEADRMEKLIRGLQPKLKGSSIEVTGGINRPPMERTAATEELYKKAYRIATTLGFDLTEASVGGGSDGNFTAALGIPTLDGLGCVGDGPHAEYEHILVDTLPQRSALVAQLLTEL